MTKLLPFLILVVAIVATRLGWVRWHGLAGRAAALAVWAVVLFLALKLLFGVRAPF
jgi:uncharacterized membrane protein YtjA (UPF0391 family)